MLSLSRVQLFATPWTVARQAPLSMGILQARILEWVALLQGIFPAQGSNPGLLHCKQIFYHLSHQKSPPLTEMPDSSPGCAFSLMAQSQ